MYDLSDPYLTDTFLRPSYFHINWDIKLKLWVIKLKALRNVYLLLNIHNYENNNFQKIFIL